MWSEGLAPADRAHVHEVCTSSDRAAGCIRIVRLQGRWGAGERFANRAQPHCEEGRFCGLAVPLFYGHLWLCTCGLDRAVHRLGNRERRRGVPGVSDEQGVEVLWQGSSARAHVEQEEPMDYRPTIKSMAAVREG